MWLIIDKLRNYSIRRKYRKLDLGDGSMENTEVDKIDKTEHQDDNGEVSPDYRNFDGILMCGRCHAPKETYVKVDETSDLYERFKKYKFPILCRCEKEKEEAENKKLVQKEQQLVINRLQKEGITDKSYLSYTFKHDDNENPEVSNACKKYAENFEDMYNLNKGLILYGQVGTGKTFYACCIANAVLAKGKSVLVTNIPSLLTSLSRNQEEKIRTLNKVSNVSLLVVDDLGVERDTQDSLESVFEVIDTRYRSGKPLLITTNLEPKEMKKPDDIRYQRIYNRIFQMCHPVAVIGESRRDKRAEESAEFMNDFLGLAKR